MAVDLDQERRRDKERAFRIEHVEYVADGPIRPKHMLEDLFGDDDVEFLVKYVSADVVIWIAHGSVSYKTEAFPSETADFERRGVPKIELADQASCFLVHDNANPMLIAVGMQLRPGEPIGFLDSGNALEL